MREGVRFNVRQREREREIAGAIWVSGRSVLMPGSEKERERGRRDVGAI